MRRIAASFLVLAILPAHSALAAKRSRHGHLIQCPHAHIHVVAANSHGEVYVKPGFDGPEVFSCPFARPHVFLLGEVPELNSAGSLGLPESGVQDETVGGPYLAYESHYNSKARKRWVIIVRRLIDNKIVQTIPTGPASLTGAVGDGETEDIVLSEDGSVAWTRPIAGGAGRPGEAIVWQLRAFDKGGARLLATGADLDPHSMAIAHGTLYWTQGGHAESTALN